MVTRVLVVDASADERALCMRMLEMSEPGLQVRAVNDPIGYADALADGEFDIAVIGVRLGFCAASDLVRSLHKRLLPVVLMVAPGEEDMAIALERQGVARRVPKTPAGFLELPRAVREVLDGVSDQSTVGGIPEALVDAVGGGKFTITPDGRLLRSSGPALASVPRTSLERAVNSRLEGTPSLLAALRGGRALRWSDVGLQTRDGATTVDLALCLTLTEHGEELLVGVVMTKPAVAAATTSGEVEQALSRLRQTTHDLKAPLRGVARTLDMLRAPGSSLSTEDRSMMDGAHASLTDAIDALRGVLGGGQERAPTTSNTADPPEVIESESPGLTSASTVMSDIRRALAPELAGLGAVLRVGDLPDLPVEARDLRTILTNLIDNALKHRSAGAPSVTVQATRRGSDWLFSVTDDGPGIPSHEIESIFEMNRRGSTARGGGNGMGLALCRQAVERYGGAIWVTTGAGSTFHFTLPAIGLVSERTALDG